MTTHELKTWPQHFDPLVAGKKRAELRLNDRNFQVGDWIKFREWVPDDMTITKGRYTGNMALAVIIHIAEGTPIPEGYVLLSIAPPQHAHNA